MTSGPLPAGRTRVKMCGTTRREDALAAARYGVDALGFIFYRKSPRYIAPEAAAAIISALPPFVDRVGVFVDATLAEVVHHAGLGLSLIQLHGEETPEYCGQLREKLPHIGLIKAFRVNDRMTADAFSPYVSCVDAYLLDTFVKNEPGGTGRVFDWSLVSRLDLRLPVILAGGISPENVVQAIAAVRPYAVDVNSTIELQPGIKDTVRLQALLREVSRHAAGSGE